MKKLLAVALATSVLSLGALAAEPAPAPATPDAATHATTAHKAKHAKKKAHRAANKKRKMHKATHAGMNK